MSTASTSSDPSSPDLAFDFTKRITDAVNGAIDVAWDLLHEYGWQPRHVRMDRHIGSPERTRLVLVAGETLARDLPVFEVTTEMIGLDVHVTHRWLASPPRP